MLYKDEKQLDTCVSILFSPVIITEADHCSKINTRKYIWTVPKSMIFGCARRFVSVSIILFLPYQSLSATKEDFLTLKVTIVSVMTKCEEKIWIFHTFALGNLSKTCYCKFSVQLFKWIVNPKRQSDFDKYMLRCRLCLPKYIFILQLLKVYLSWESIVVWLCS